MRDIRRAFQRLEKSGIKIKASKLKLGLNSCRSWALSRKMALR